jgi:hypothetical protein
MKKILLFLTVYALSGQSKQVAAQVAAAQGQVPDQFFNTNIRSPVVLSVVSSVESSVVSSVESSAVPSAAPATTSSFRGPKSPMSQAEIRRCCEKIIKDGQRIYYLNSRNGKMKLQIRGIYTRGEAIFLSLRLINRSPLDYDVDSIRFFLTQKEKGVHPAGPRTRVKTLLPVYVYDSATLIKGYGRVTSVIVLPRLTLGKGERLLIEVLEKNGGRQLQVQASNFTLVNAKLI